MSVGGIELRSSTILRLEALGIDPNSVLTESQAQMVIAQAEAAPSVQKGKQQGGDRLKLISEAKNLAQDVGARYEEQDSLEIILDKIADIVQIRKKKEDVQVYQEKLGDIAQRADIVIKIQENIFNELNMISISNKLILGL